METRRRAQYECLLWGPITPWRGVAWRSVLQGRPCRPQEHMPDYEARDSLHTTHDRPHASRTFLVMGSRFCTEVLGKERLSQLPKE